MLSRCRLVFLIAILIFLPLLGLSQTTTSGSICGRVFDPAHAAVPSAAISLTSTATNTHIVIGSGAAGDFCFLQLAPGTFEVVVESGGFAVSRSIVIVEVGRITPLTIVLRVAAQAEVMELKRVRR
jgi:hypothetical protein